MDWGSGHDTLNIGNNIENKISESTASVITWDGKELHKYEALGRASRKEFLEAVKIMDAFIGRKGAFLPKVIIIDNKGRYLETTNRTKLPRIEKMKKTSLFGYSLFEKDMPLTNPQDISLELEKQFEKSDYSRLF